MTDTTPRAIIEHYERCLAAHGDGARAVDWKSERDAALRYDVMLSVIRPDDGRVSLLDLGCGLGDLKTRIDRTRPGAIDYAGADVSAAFVERARARHPGATFHRIDVLEAGHDLPVYDYVVMNGVFTRSETLSDDAMFAHLERMLAAVWPHARRGLAFNVMSDLADWRTDALFHPSSEAVAALLARRLSRHVAMRGDYGLHENAWFVWREPWAGATPEAAA